MSQLTPPGAYRSTILLALALMAIIVMMILPMPAWVLDMGLAASFALAILIFTVTLFIERPLDFSSFPTILLASLMLRLSLNVSSTKLIIGEGHSGTGAAGNVIKGFANFIMGGNIFLGLVVFGVLLIVNFMVITKGAARMAEVSARFALDGMPGKQLAIDSDVSAGAIGHKEAKERREREQQETTFFGSLDGASKFVKGDAVAGLLITLLNLVMGLAMGIVIHGMPMSQAFETYAILTVGDGLVTQIPAVIISIASALLLARGGMTGATDFALFTQIGRYPSALATVGVLLAVFALVPGLPFLPFMTGAIALGTMAYWIQIRPAPPTPDPEEEIPLPQQRRMGDVLEVDDIHIEFSADLVDVMLDPGTGLDARISNMRDHIARQFGLILPEIRLTDDPSRPPGNYAIRIQGVEAARAELRPNHLLALDPEGHPRLPVGETVAEPVYGAPARWIPETAGEEAALDGVTLVTPVEVMATHLLEVIKKNLSRLLTLKTLQRLLDEMVNLSSPDRSEANRKLLNELVPDRLSVDVLHQALRHLLSEQVSIRNLPLILEAAAEAGGTSGAAPDLIAEHIRQRLGFQLVGALRREDGSLPLIQLAPEWETRFSSYEIEGRNALQDVALPPEMFAALGDAIASEVSLTGEQGMFPGIITSARRRRFLRTVLSARNIDNPVLSFEEIGLDAKPLLVGTVAA